MLSSPYRIFEFERITFSPLYSAIPTTWKFKGYVWAGAEIRKRAGQNISYSNDFLPSFLKLLADETSSGLCFIYPGCRALLPAQVLHFFGFVYGLFTCSFTRVIDNPNWVVLN